MCKSLDRAIRALTSVMKWQGKQHIETILLSSPNLSKLMVTHPTYLLPHRNGLYYSPVFFSWASLLSNSVPFGEFGIDVYWIHGAHQGDCGQSDFGTAFLSDVIRSVFRNSHSGFRIENTPLVYELCSISLVSHYSLLPGLLLCS